MATINWAQIHAQVAVAPEAKKAAFNIANEVFTEAKDEMINEFDEHIVTQEILEREATENISHTLLGLSKSHGGNLFSFIGFYAGDEPIEHIRRLLINYTKLNKFAFSSAFQKGSPQSILFSFKVTYPSNDDIGKASQYPNKWSNGSWAIDIENGIDGLAHYIYDEDFGAYEQSRSTTALEAKNGDGMITVRSEEKSTPIRYLSEIIGNFKDNLQT